MSNQDGLVRAGIEITAWSVVLLGITVVSISSVSAVELLVAGIASVGAAFAARRVRPAAAADLHGVRGAARATLALPLAALRGLAVLVSEYGLHGKARKQRLVGVLFVIGALALAGLPPFGTGLGKALGEDAAGHWQPWLPAVFVAASAATGAAVLRVALRIFWAVGPAVRGRTDEEETTGEGEEPEIRTAQRALPPTMIVVPAILLALAFAAGCVPAFADSLVRGAALFTDPARYSAVVTAGPDSPQHLPVPAAAWTWTGVLLGMLSAGLAVALAVATVHRRVPRLASGHPLTRIVRSLRRLHSGRLGDYTAWLAPGIAVLCAAITAQT
ncbi:hypothetical protein [Kitasatospora sp. NPDC048407]|uniref:hypothetical protein n=1 Tax=Kitasatospora sp. NPDC048407 TaxID=3364051 RepID=UPI003724210D